MSGVPSGWRDDGHTLYSPSHIQGGPEVPITGPFRDYVLGNAWRPSDRFIEVGHHVTTMQYSNAALGSGFIQHSIWSELLMPDSGAQAGKVLYGWLGVENAAVRGMYEGALAHIAQLEQQIAALQAEIAGHVTGVDPAKVADRLTALGSLGKQVETLAAQQFI